MSRTTITPISHSQVNILEHNHFLNTNMKITKTVTTLNASGILPAGTIIDKTGKVVNDSTAFGVVYEDVDFTNSSGTEVVAVVLHGFVNSAVLPVQPLAATITALNLIKFL